MTSAGTLLHGRTALITGGANGIGRACALRLARAGASVTVVDRDEAAVKEVAEMVGGRAVVADLLTVMLVAPFRLARICLPRMYAAGWGRVVNISSVHGLRASPFKSAYVSAKHGLEGLSKVIALEGAEHGVTSNCVNPAYVRTALVEKQIDAQARTHGIAAESVVRDIMLAPAAIKRLIEPEEVADLVAYLCSPEASFITGASMMMDGGWSAH